MTAGTIGIFWFFNLLIIGVPLVLVIYTLLLAIKALKIYIAKNS